MTDILILKALSNNEMSLGDIKKLMDTPPPQQTLKEQLGAFREMKEILGDIGGTTEPEQSDNGIITLVNNALPIIRDMLPAKKQEMKEVVQDVRGGEKTSIGILKPIQQEASRDTGKPISPVQESGASSITK